MYQLSYQRKPQQWHLSTILGKFYMLLRCYRCGEIKDKERFKPGQPYWSRWCIRCQDSPIGALPRIETENDKVK